jgi:serine/threonine protein kinase
MDAVRGASTSLLLEEEDVQKERLLGSGGFGAVWQVRRRDGSCCIAKVAEPKRNTEEARRMSRDMLNHEYQMLLHCSGIDGVPQLLGRARIDGAPAILLEHIAGTTWRAALRKPCKSSRQFLRHAVTLSHTLACLHARGIVHGDMKPENVLLGRPAGTNEKSRSFLTDFGMAHKAGEHPFCPGGTLGTRGYIDPRMIERAEERDAGSDVYGFGAMAFEGYTSSPFFTSDDWTEALLLRRRCDDGTVPHDEFVAWYGDMLTARSDLFHTVPDRVPAVEELIVAILRYPTRTHPRPSATEVALRLLECLVDM